MINLNIYCMAIKYFRILDNLSSYIKPLGLGNNTFPKHWSTEKNGMLIGCYHGLKKKDLYRITNTFKKFLSKLK